MEKAKYPGGRFIDYDRGVHIRMHPSGVEVFMYVDTPGVYLNVHGDPFPSIKFAQEAGFDTETLARQRKIKEGVAEYEAKLRSELDLPISKRRILKEWEGYKVVELSPGRFQLFGPDDLVLHKDPLPEKEALKLLEALVPEVSK